METIFIIFLTIIIILIGLDAFLAICFLKFKKKLSFLFKGKKVMNIEEAILSQVQEIKKQDENIKEIFDRIKRLEGVSEKTFQKIGMVRFNPFNDMGGNQSFAVALLNDKNDGFVISSLFIKEGNRVYAKSIKVGQSDYPLSKEEKEAVEKAINQK